MFASFSDRLNFGAGGGTVSNQPSAFPTRPPTVGATFASSFISAAGLTDGTQIAAINRLTDDLVMNGFMDKFLAIYPFVGGTASSHIYNLKDPRNTDDAFRLTFSGGITHSSTGVYFNGSNGFANTFLIVPPRCWNNLSFVLYSTKNVTGGGGGFPVDIGSANNTTNGVPGQGGFIRRTDNSCLANFPNLTGSPSGTVTTTVTNASGLFVFTVTANNLRRIYRNGSLLATSTIVSNYEPYTQPIYIGAAYYANVPGAGLFSLREFGFVAIGFGLSDTENTLLYNIIQLYQQNLGRSV